MYFLHIFIHLLYYNREEQNMNEDGYLDGDDDVGSAEHMDVLWETREWDDYASEQERECS